MSRGQPDSVTGLRPVVHAFALLMERKLQRDDTKKGHWRREGISVLWAMLQREMQELDAALMAPEPDEAIVLECADVANLAMMIADVLTDLTRDKEIKSQGENRVAVGADEGDSLADAGDRGGPLRHADSA
jgi:hypothetical protein